MSRSHGTSFWPASVWALGAFVLLSVLSLLVPPMQSPDENAHLMRAEMLSRGQWLLHPPPFGTPVELASPGGEVDAGLAQYSHAFMETIAPPGGPAPAAVREKTAHWNWAHATVFYPAPGTGYYFPLIYAPQALALWLGRTLGWSVPDSYQLARSCALLVVCLLTAMAWRHTPPNPAVIAVATLPMGLFQAVSPTLDGITTALALLAISQFIAHARTPPAEPGQSLPWGFLACILLLVTSRTHLLPLLLLPVFLAWKRQSAAAWAATALLVAACLAWLGFAMASTTDGRVVREHSTTEIVLLYAGHPAEFLALLGRTLGNHELVRFYGQSFIGILGWLDTPLKSARYGMLSAGLLLAASLSFLWRRPADAPARWLLCAVALASSLLVFVALAVTWTPYAAPAIAGVQGRYFVVPALLLGYALGDAAPHRPTWQQWGLRGLAVAMVLASLAALVETLVQRYAFWP